MNINIITIPEKKENLEINKKLQEMIEDRSRVIASKLKVDVMDINVNLYGDGSKVASIVGRTSDDKLGIFSGYVDYEDKFHMAHPKGIEPIFGENLWKQISIMVDYCLYKFYLCKTFFPKEDDYKLYYKYLTDSVAKLLSGNYNRESVLYEVRHYSNLKKYKKDTELKMVFFVILEKSETSMIIDNLKQFYDDCNIQKSLMKIYKKEFKELVGLYQKELQIKEKDLKKVR